ncbi:MAG: hypothetical protein JNM84_12625 [Planctomycetes bacterium]|nr:hypothetical protein [Planctomycetota bacterium]
MHTLRSPLRGALIAALCTTLCVRAQEPESPSRALPTELLASVLRVPLQPLSAAEAEELGAGFAAAEAGYKVRFVDGFELFPALGEQRATNAPLRWRTRSLAIGEHELVRDAAVAPRRLDDRTVIYEHADFVERYEIRPEGVEQLFVLSTPLDVRGDLVIRGAIETPLRAAERALEHAEIVFREETGAPVVSYGVAVAFDACGRTIAMPSSYRSGEIALHLDGAWLARASFPVTIDPLAAPVFLSGSAPNGGALSSLEIEAANGVGTRNVLVAFTRAISLSDHDVYAVLCDESFASPLLIYTNIDATYSDTDAQVAFVNRHDRWVLCSERRRATPNGEHTRLRIYSFLATNLQVNAGTEQLSTTPVNADHTRADLGGSVAGDFGDTALLCYQADAGAAGTLSDHSEIHVAPFDAQTQVLGAAQVLSATPVGTRYDREDPALNARRWGQGDGWIVGWRELDRQSANDDWDVRAVRTNSLGARLQEAELYDAGGARDVRSFQLAGIGNLYLLAATLSTTQGSSNVTGLVSRRFDWSAAASQPTNHATRNLLEDPWFLASLQVSSLAMESATQSHWVIALQQRVPASGFGTRTVAKLLRVGGTGAELERETLFDLAGTSTPPPSVCRGWETMSFLAVCGATNASALVRGTRLEPPVDASSAIQGQGCDFASLSCSPPYAGHQGFRVLLSGGQSGQPAALLVSLGTANLSLPVFASPSCMLLVDLGPTFIAAFPASISSGFAEVALPLPDAPVFRGDFEVQWVHVRTFGSPTGIFTTPRLHVQVR